MNKKQAKIKALRIIAQSALISKEWLHISDFTEMTEKEKGKVTKEIYVIYMSLMNEAKKIEKTIKQ